jgi:uncharacterized protein involved in cysteine biosynthesis
MLNSISRTLAQLSDPKLRSVLVISVLGTLALILALTFGAIWMIEQLGQTGIGWIDAILPWLAGIGTFVLALLAFPGTVQVLSGVFLDRVAEAVEARHYTDLPPARPQPLSETIIESLRFALVSIGLNLLVLPLYLLLPGINLLLFYGLNGYLLGREYAELVATRRMTHDEIKDFRIANRGRLFLGGVVIAAATTVPVLNLATPVLATAFALHEHQRLQLRAKRG